MGEIGVGLVGYKFMGRAHSSAYRQVRHFFPVDPVPRMRVLCGRGASAVASAAAALGWDEHTTDYRQLVERDDIGLVDVASSGDTHREITVAALAAGKHVLCEKPLANTLDEAGEMVQAARRAGTVAMVCFNYRRAPAVQLAKRLVQQGRIGRIRHWRAVYLQDWLVDPSSPMTWRLRRESAGSGALGDLGSHLVDLAHFLVGPIAEVTGLAETFIAERPREAPADAVAGRVAPPGTDRVTVDDSVAFLARFEGGATGTFEATRLAPGRKAYEAFEINGSRGSLAFDLHRMNELRVCFADDPPDVSGFRTVLVTEPEHPYVGAWWPPGHIVGYEHTFVHTVKDLLDGIGAGASPAPGFGDGYRCQAVLDAVERSTVTRGWVRPKPEHPSERPSGSR